MSNATWRRLQATASARKEHAVIKIGQRPQRSLGRSVEISGTGFVTGARVTIRFCPAPADTGLVFQRVDLKDAKPIPVRAEAVTDTRRRTTLGTGANQVMLIEHAVAALAGMRIDNCFIELDGPEPPGLDGSAADFVESIVAGGVVLNAVQRGRFAVAEPVLLRQGGATLSLYPHIGDELLISYILDYGPNSPIAPQTHTETIVPDYFQRNIAPSRTFLLEEEAQELQKQGVGQHLTAAEVLVFSPNGLIGNKLRHPNEPARHKILDLVGDLALCGLELVGHIVAYRSGHPLNVELAQTISRMPRTSNCVATHSRKAA
jgi:UDP-3-O-[3-hydroxymyristoyl] N-acetylglucosamine deacetylase